jgi:5-formyltetrahydrofolate cyclo-ligase
MRDKDLLRDKIKATRKGLPQASVERWSQAIRERVLGLVPVQQAVCLLCYVSIGNEVATHDLIRALLARGKQVAGPLINPETETFVPRIIFDFDSDLRPGSFGILQPRLKRSEPCELSRLRVVLVPGVAFDERGNRLGRGQGYFDHFLRRLPESVRRIGLAYECQVVPSVPAGPNDEPVDLIVTEKRVIECPRRP